MTKEEELQKDIYELYKKHSKCTFLTIILFNETENVLFFGTHPSCIPCMRDSLSEFIADNNIHHLDDVDESIN